MVALSDQSATDLASTTTMDQVNFCGVCLYQVHPTSNGPPIYDPETPDCPANADCTIHWADAELQTSWDTLSTNFALQITRQSSSKPPNLLDWTVWKPPALQTLRHPSPHITSEMSSKNPAWPDCTCSRISGAAYPEIAPSHQAKHFYHKKNKFGWCSGHIQSWTRSHPTRWRWNVDKLDLNETNVISFPRKRIMKFPCASETL